MCGGESSLACLDHIRLRTAEQLDDGIGDTLVLVPSATTRAEDNHFSDRLPSLCIQDRVVRSRLPE